MPVKVKITQGGWTLLHPTTEWQTARMAITPADFAVDPNFYVETRNANAKP
jgi:hypothetical protein